MAQVKLLKIASDGLPLEFDSANDDITLKSFAVTGGGPALSATGLALNIQPITGLTNITFNDPTANTINQTAGALIVNNIMAKERENLMTTAGGISFPVITDSAGQVDSFRLPALAGVPTASPTTAGAGHLLYDSTNKNLYAWDGSAWDNLNTVTSAAAIDVSGYSAEEALAIRDAVYISSADNVSKADNTTATKAQVIGFTTSAVLITDPVPAIRRDGQLSGFSGMTAGARQFLSNTSGLITETIPAGSGQTIVQVGYAKSATVLEISIENLGRRA